MSEMSEHDKNSPRDKNWEEVSNRDTDPEMDIESVFAAGDDDLGAVAPENEPQITDETVSSLQQKLEASKAEAKKHFDQLLRLQAEMQNLERRSRIDLEKAHKYGITKLVEDLVPVLDGLEQGLQMEQNEDNEALNQMHAGLELTYNSLLKTVQKYGIEQLNPQGTIFNPETHEAISMVEDENYNANTVISVFQKGYILNGRLLRPARVVVAK